MSSGGPTREGGEHGSATVYAVVLTCLLLVGLSLAVSGAGVVAARQRARVAADLAALAAVAAPPVTAERDAGVRGGKGGCAAARLVAQANRTTVLRCELTGDVALVVTRAELPGVLSRLPAPRATAKAGWQ